MCILLAVAFLTLLERKIIGVIQRRVGPNKILFVGFVQPIVDGLKLFFKRHIVRVIIFPTVLSLVIPLILLCILDLNTSYILLVYLGALSIRV